MLQGGNSMPAVSIIVPVYNAEKALKRCIDSILNQEYEDFELIAVDDGSKDESPAILDAYAAKDPRVTVIHKKNSGVSSTRNLALDQAKGKYIQFLDADDWIPDNSTKMLVREAEDKNVDLVVGDFFRVVGKNVSRKGSIVSNDILTLPQFAELMMESPSDFYYGVLWNKLYRNDIIQEYGVRMDEELSWCEDFIFNLEYLLHVKTVTALQIPVYYYVKTEGSLVSKSMSLAKIVDMKANVFTYYNDFYKNVLDEKQYRKDRLAIAGFLIDAANDDVTLPMMPGTKKLGKEQVRAHFKGDLQNAVTVAYYLNKAYEKNLSVVALKYGIELKDAKVLAALKEIGQTNSFSEIADLSGVNEMSVASGLMKMAVKGFVSVKYTAQQVVVTFGRNADPICQDLEIAVKDLHDLMTKNLSEEQQDMAADILKQVSENFRKYVRTDED
jgi:glycosyltransferase involved in cell wall biosynthesis